MLDSKNMRHRWTVNSVATTGITLDDGTGAEVFSEADTGTYSTEALLAQQLASLINGSGTLDITASQDTPGVDTYFYTEGDTFDGYISSSIINMAQLSIRKNSYPLTDLVGGTIIEDTNVI